MASTQLAPPYPIWTDKNGDPLDAGYLYFGVANENPETNPITVYYDRGFTQPVAQPVRTSNGYVMRNGSPALIYSDSNSFSITVRNKRNELVIYSPTGYGVTPGIPFAVFENAAKDVAALLADTHFTYNPAITGTVQVTAGDILRTLAEGFAYEVAPSGATDEHVTTAGGVKLYVQPKSGRYELAAFGAVGDGVTDDTVAVQTWASLAGRLYHASGVYAISTMIDVVSSRVEGSGTFLWVGAAEGEMFNFTVSSTRWVGGEIDGNHLAKTGIRSLTVGGHIIDSVKIHSISSLNSRALGVLLESAVGSQVANCTIYDIFALGNATPGDAAGVSRAILGTLTTALTSPHIFENNVIYDIWGEEGDGIQILLFDGTFPMKSAAGSVIQGNRIYGCGRRAVKIQASDVSVIDNNLTNGGGNPPPTQSGIPGIVVINLINVDNCLVSRNIVRAADDFKSIAVVGGSGLYHVGNVVIDNDIYGVSASDTVFIANQESFSFSKNRIRGGRRSLAIGDSRRGAIVDNMFIASVADGTNPDMNTTNDCFDLYVARNIGLGGTKDHMIAAAASECVYLENAVFRDTGNGVRVIGQIEALVSGNFATGAGNAVLSSINSARIARSVNLGSGSTGFGGDILWTASDPTISRANRKHQAGDIAFNTSAGLTVGWRCTASGTPGTWSAFT